VKGGQGMKNILVVKLSAIGDVIHALPVSYAIKETYPDAHLTWVVEPTAYPILEDNPYIDDIILFEKAKFRSIGGFLREMGPFRKRLRVRHYDASLDLQGLFKSAAIVWNAGAKLRIGTVRVNMQKFTRQISLKCDHGQRMPEHVMYIAGDALALADHIKFRLGFVGVFTQLD